MLKITFVFVVFFAVAYGKPGYLTALPAATSHASRVDIIHPQPIVKAYVEPYYGHGYGGLGYGSGYSYANRLDVHGHALPIGVGHLGYDHLGLGHLGYGHLGYGGWAY